METPGYYAIIPASVRYAENLKPNAKLLYGEITALCNATGICTARNDYFANLYQVNLETVSRWISQLRDGGFIDVEILQNQNNLRKISIDKKVNRYCQKGQEVLSKKSRGLVKKVNSIKENITINNTINTISSHTAFEFLQNNAASQLEAALMTFKSQMPDFTQFVEYYNLRIEKDETEFKPRVLIASMKMIANTWIQNLSKQQFQSGNTPEQIINPTYRRNIV